jgi:hypothetical protein
MRWLRPLVYVWVFPGTAVGLFGTALALVSGGKARVVDGVIEAHGGWITMRLNRGNRWVGPIAAITRTSPRPPVRTLGPLLHPGLPRRRRLGRLARLPRLLRQPVRSRSLRDRRHALRRPRLNR